MPLFAGLRSVLGRFWSGLRPLLGGGDRDEIKPLNLEIAIDRIDPAYHETISVRATVSPESGPASTALETDSILGVRRAFTHDGDSVRLEPGFSEEVAMPASVMDFDNPHQHGKSMDFRIDDLVFPEESVVDGEVTLALGVFEDGLESTVTDER